MKRIKPDALRPLLPLSIVVVGLGLSILTSGCGNSTRGASANGNPIDRAFVSQMIPHHRSAIDMARIAATRGQSIFVRQLASNIIVAQSREITQMQSIDSELAKAGIKQGDLGLSMDQMGMGMAMDSTHMLKSTGASRFDREFLTMMIGHHQGAIRMAVIEQSQGLDAALKRLARGIVASQSSQISQMRAHRSA